MAVSPARWGHVDTQPLPAIGAPSTPEAPEVPRRGLAT